MFVVTAGAIALVVLAIGAELSARWAIRRQARCCVFPPDLRMRVEVDRNVLPELDAVARFDVNRDGERGSEVPATEGLYRVLVVGGSQGEGFFLDQDATWPVRLERLLQAPDALGRLGASRVHVGNISRSGVGSAAVDLILARVLPRYPRLQLIIVCVGVSDVMRWLELGATPAIPTARVADVFQLHPEGPFGWTPSALAIVELARRARRRWLRPTSVYRGAGTWLGRARAMRASARDIRDEVPNPGPMLDHFEVHFRSLLERAFEHADRVLVIRQPWLDKRYTAAESRRLWHGGVGQVWRETPTVYYSFDVFSRLMALLDARAAQVARAAAVQYVDVAPSLEPSFATYYDAFHLTPSGAEAMAAAVASALLRQPLAAASRPPVNPASSLEETGAAIHSSASRRRRRLRRPARDRSNPIG